jgi:hypothetical protein
MMIINSYTTTSNLCTFSRPRKLSRPISVGDVPVYHDQVLELRKVLRGRLENKASSLSHGQTLQDAIDLSFRFLHPQD